MAFLRRLLPRVAPYRGALAGAAVLLLFSTAIGLVFPLVVRSLLDQAFVSGSGETLDSIAVGLLVLFLAQGVMNFGQSYLTASVSERVVADLRREIFDALVWQPPGFFTSRRVGELTSRIASDAGLVQQILRFGIPELARQGIFLVGAAVIVTVMAPRLTVVAFVAIPFAIVVAWYFGRKVRGISAGIQDTLAAAVARAEQVFGQIRTVQSFTREGWESERFGVEIARVRDEGLRRAVARALLTGAVTFTAFGAIVLVLWQGGRLVLAGDLTGGTLVAFLLFAVTIAGAITSLAGFWGNLQEAAGAARRIFEIIDTERSLADPPDPRPLPRPVRGDIRYEEVSFRYGPELDLVLRGIDFRVEEGETVALVGSSGAGKSTIASLLTRFYDVESGRVTLDGIDVREVALGELRSVIGVVPQEPALFAGTIRENLLYGNGEATEEEMVAAARSAHAHGFVPQEPALFAGTIRENLLYGNGEATEEEMVAAARSAHAHGFVSALPDGYDQRVGERGVTLSAGQRQRIAIARVMLKRPRVLVLDEASSSLDAESERLVQDALERLMRERSTLVIAHRLSTVIRADRIVVLEAGVIEDTGVHAGLLDRSDTYARLYRRQFEDALATAEGAGLG